MDSLNHWFFHITNTLDDFGYLHFLETSTRVWVKIWCPKNWMVTKKEQNLRFGCRISPGMFFPLPRFFFPDLFCFPSPASILPLPFHAACYLQHFGAGTLACLLAGLLACTPVCENLAGKKKRGGGKKIPVKIGYLWFVGPYVLTNSHIKQTQPKFTHSMLAENICHFTWIH